MWQEDALVQTVNNESGFSCKKNKSSGCSKFKQKLYMYFLEYSTLNLSLQLSEFCLDKCWKKWERVSHYHSTKKTETRKDCLETKMNYTLQRGNFATQYGFFMALPTMLFVYFFYLNQLLLAQMRKIPALKVETNMKVTGSLILKLMKMTCGHAHNVTWKTIQCHASVLVAGQRDMSGCLTWKGKCSLQCMQIISWTIRINFYFEEIFIIIPTA